VKVGPSRNFAAERAVEAFDLPVVVGDRGRGLSRWVMPLSRRDLVERTFGRAGGETGPVKTFAVVGQDLLWWPPRARAGKGPRRPGREVARSTRPTAIMNGSCKIRSRHRLDIGAVIEHYPAHDVPSATSIARARLPTGR